MLASASDVPTHRTVRISASEDTDRAIENANEENTKIVFESGDHTPRQQHSPADNTAWVAEDGAVLKATRDGGHWFLSGTVGGALVVDGFSVDYSDVRGNLGFRILTRGDALLRDIEFVGYNWTEDTGSPVDNIAPLAVDEDATFVLDNVRRSGPTKIVSHGSQGGDANEGAIWVGEKHRGTLVIKNSHLENTGTNALYASRPGDSAVIRLEDTTFKNCNQAGVRLGGGDVVDVRRCSFLVDTDNAHPENDGEYINPTGAVFETNDASTADITVRGTTFRLESGPSGAKNAFIDGNAGPVKYLGCTFYSALEECENVHMRSSPRWFNQASDLSVTFRDTELGGNGPIKTGGRPVTVRNGALACPVEGAIETVGNVAREAGSLANATAAAVTDGGRPTYRLTVKNTSNDDGVNYRVRAAGGVEAADGTSVSKWESLDGGTLNAWVNHDTDEWTVTGQISNFEFLEGETEVALDGKTVENPEKDLPSLTAPDTGLSNAELLALAAIAYYVLKG